MEEEKKDQKNQSTELATRIDPFSVSGFNLIQRYGVMFAKSEIIPKAFQGKEANCIIAMDMAVRLNMPPIMVMQNLYVVNGNVGWSSKFLIAGINASGRFSPLDYEVTGEGMDRGCVAFAFDKSTGIKLTSPRVSMQMAKDEGWIDKNGSKWKTMPEVMLRYRAASMFSRLYCPEITMGFSTVEEIDDINDVKNIVIKEKAEKANKKVMNLDEVDDAEIVVEEQGTPKVIPSTKSTVISDNVEPPSLQF